MVLLEAGASVDKVSIGLTPLEWVVGNDAAYQPVIAALVEAGADVNYTDRHGRSVLTKAAGYGTATTVTKLISAGAVDLDRALAKAIENGRIRSCAPILRAGAALPVDNDNDEDDDIVLERILHTRAYMEKIDAAGSFKAYEKAHRQQLTAIFLPKSPTLPAEMLGRIVEFTFDIGGH